jgi:hypothetical protein
MRFAVTVYQPTEFDDSKREPTLEFISDPNALAAEFRESSIPVPDDRHCYIYDNEVQTWSGRVPDIAK